MAEPNTKVMNKHTKYVKSNEWQCPKSPTGAHHWVEHSHADLPGVFYCKWCFEVKEFPVTLAQAMVASGLPAGSVNMARVKKRTPDKIYEGDIP